MRIYDRAHTARGPLTALAAVGALLALASCSSETAAQPAPDDGSSAAAPTAIDPVDAPGGDDFYTPPTDLGSEHGRLIWQRPFDGPAALPGAVNTAYLYTQLGLDAEIVATSAFVAVPEGDAPADGWPVVSWAHGTTGIADQCAPTRYDDYTSGSEALLASWIDAGYAVVSTDYEGLGTPGEHPYLIGRSEARAALDAVTAARLLDPSLGNELVVAGHSQGGHAALWAAAIAPTYLADVDLRGAIALAPPSGLEAQMGLLQTQTASSATGTVALILRGSQIVDPSIDETTLLSKRAQKLFPQTLTECLSDLGARDSFGGLPLNRLLGSRADVDPIREVVAANDPAGLTIKAPVLLTQGLDDTTVISLFTDALAPALEANGTEVDYETYPGVTHGGLPDASLEDADAFLARAFG